MAFFAWGFRLDARCFKYPMFSIFASKHVKQGRQYIKDGKKLLAYKKDLWTEAQVSDFEAGIVRLERACGSGDRNLIEAAALALDEQCGRVAPPLPNAGWRENSEVFLVAIIVALGVRTYFVQPFTIPTGSMWPTLNGIMGHPTVEAPPNFAVQIFQQAVLGRGWVNTLAREDETVIGMAERPRRVSVLGFFSVSVPFLTETVVQTDKGEYAIHAPMRTLADHFEIYPGKMVKKDEPLARGYVETGDHVFVDKFTYHFRKPDRGDVFVFNTQHIAKMGNLGPPPAEPSQFYIKRLVGTPGDRLRIAPPELFINGELAKGAVFARVMGGKDGYRGYSNVAEFNFPGGRVATRPMDFLNSPEATMEIPAKRYWAQGDNSYHSSDSRDWGTVPQDNIVGRGILVYWPMASHWGLIR